MSNADFKKAPPQDLLTTPQESATFSEMTIFEHLSELRRRLIVSFGFVATFSIGAFLFSKPLFSLLTEPYFSDLETAYLIGTGPAEAFLLRIKVALLAGFFLAIPVIFYQVWLFISPGLYSHEKQLFLPFVISTSLLFLSGVAFCFYAVLPFAFEFFFAQYETIGVQPTIRISEHLSLVMKALIGFGVAFEMPVLAFFLGRLGIINHLMLLRSFRYAVVVIFIVSAFLTPPDVLSQLLLAGPLIVLYLLSIVLVKYTGKEVAKSQGESDDS
jgi:sec-independent protein translocase protein TatC